MAHSLTEQAQQRNITVAELVIEALERHNSIQRAAIELKVSPNSIRYQLRKANLRIERPRIIVTEAKS